MTDAFEKLEELGLEGLDASLKESLIRYGFAWREYDDSWFIVYGVRMCCETDDYISFGTADYPKDTDPRDEWNFVDWKNVAEFCGMTEDEFFEWAFPMIVEAILGYYGYESVFGVHPAYSICLDAVQKRLEHFAEKR